MVAEVLAFPVPRCVKLKSMLCNVQEGESGLSEVSGGCQSEPGEHFELIKSDVEGGPKTCCRASPWAGCPVSGETDNDQNRFSRF